MFFAVSYGSINYAVIFYSVQVETITQSKDHFREINKRGVRMRRCERRTSQRCMLFKYRHKKPPHGGRITFPCDDRYFIFFFFRMVIIE